MRFSGSIEAECRRLLPRRTPDATAVPVDEVELWSEYRLLPPDGDARGLLPATVGLDFSIVGTWNRRIEGVAIAGGAGSGWSTRRPPAEPTLPLWLPELGPVRPLPVLVASLAVVGGEGSAPWPREKSGTPPIPSPRSASLARVGGAAADAGMGEEAERPARRPTVAVRVELPKRAGELDSDGETRVRSELARCRLALEKAEVVELLGGLAPGDGEGANACGLAIELRRRRVAFAVAPRGPLEGAGACRSVVVENVVAGSGVPADLRFALLAVKLLNGLAVVGEDEGE